MLIAQELSLADVVPASIDFPWLENLTENVAYREKLVGHRGTGSGGYADHIMAAAARELFGDSDAQLSFKVLR